MLNRVLDHRSRRVHTKDPVVEYGSNVSGYDLLVRGKKVFEDFDCETCEYLFNRRSSVIVALTPQAVSSRLNAGIKTLDEALLTSIEPLLPADEYKVRLLEIAPLLKNPNYWSPLPRFRKKLKSWEYFIPLQAPKSLHAETVRSYADRLSRGDRPTALAFSKLHVTYDRQRVPALYTLVHYLLDGHHKIAAAAERCEAITLLSYFPSRHCAFSPDIRAELNEIFGIDFSI